MSVVGELGRVVGVLGAMRRRYPGLHDVALSRLIDRMLRLRSPAARLPPISS